MARFFVRATNDDISDMTAAPATVVPVSFSLWFRTTNLTDGQYLIQIQDQSEPDERMGIIFRGEIDDSIEIYQQSTAGGYDLARSDTFVTSGVWHHACGIIESSTSRRIYLDGDVGTTGTASNTPSGLDSITIGRARDSTPGFSFDGDIAEVAVWNVDINQGGTAANAQRLAEGYSPLSVLPEGLVFYAPLIRDLQDIVGGLSLTNTNTTVSDSNPRVFRPFFFNHTTTNEVAPPSISADVNITSILNTNQNATGDHLDGAEITVTFTDGTTDSAIWHAALKSSGLDEGMATGNIADANGDRVGTAWWIALDGPTTSSNFDFFNNTGKGITKLRMDLRRSGAVFDVLTVERTSGSGNGIPFTISNAPAGVTATASYSQRAGLSGGFAQGDWFAVAEVDFTNEGGFPSGSGYDEPTTDLVDHFTFKIGFDNVVYDSASIPAASVTESWDGVVVTDYTSVFDTTPSVSADFVGAICCVTFTDGTEDVAVWTAASGAVGNGWSITGVGFFTFANTGSKPIRRLRFELGGQSVVWATTNWGDNGSSNYTIQKTFGIDGVLIANSWETSDFGSKPDGVTYTNTMRNAVGYQSQNPTGDLFSMNDAIFTNSGGFAPGETIVFVAASRFATYDLATVSTLECSVPGSSYVRHCLEHKFVYRPDTRIWPMSETHCPKGNHPLRDWRTRQRGDDDSEVFDAIDIDDGLDF